MKNLFRLIILLLISKSSFAQHIYTGSTPADPQIRTALNIAQNAKVDFIKWNLSFPRPRKFLLSIQYGESQPNTLGFKNGGTSASLEGTYEAKVSNNVAVYTLRLNNGTRLSVKRIADGLLYVLTGQGNLMVGNGGWNYILSKKHAPAANQKLLIPTTIKSFLHPTVVFEGRTPCQEISKEYDFKAPSDCFKLKWLLTLTKDTASSSSGTFTLNRTLERANIVKGKWTLDANSKLTLTPEKGIPVVLIVADENILFFTDKNGALFPGNEHFSYALNKKKQTR